VIRETGWTYEYIEEMSFERFEDMLDDFDKMPPLFEVLRTQILLPGDKGYPKMDRERAEREMRNVIRESGKEPEWMRNARLKRERMKETTPHAR
jgi:hypothetical protein